jgi:hypothetical protein
VKSPPWRGFHGLRWLFVWLLASDGGRDGLADEFEDLALDGCGRGDEVEAGVLSGAVDVQPVAGQGPEVVEQGAEAVGGLPAGCGAPGRLGLRGGGAGCGCDGVGRFGPVFVGKGQRCPGFAQVPGQVGGEHADEDVRPYPGFGVVVDRAQLQIDRFDRAEVAFDVGQGLVGRHDLAGVHPGCVDGGADDVDPVQGRFGGDLFLVAGEGEGSLRDGESVLFHLVSADDFAGTEPDLPGVFDAPGVSGGGDFPAPRR